MPGMAGKGKLSGRRLDQVDRRSQVGVSGAMRTRDVSRPDEEALAAAEEELNGNRQAEEQPAPPRTD